MVQSSECLTFHVSKLLKIPKLEKDIQKNLTLRAKISNLGTILQMAVTVQKSGSGFELLSV